MDSLYPKLGVCLLPYLLLKSKEFDQFLEQLDLDQEFLPQRFHAYALYCKAKRNPSGEQKYLLFRRALPLLSRPLQQDSVKEMFRITCSFPSPGQTLAAHYLTKKYGLTPIENMLIFEKEAPRFPRRSKWYEYFDLFLFPTHIVDLPQDCISLMLQDGIANDSSLKLNLLDGWIKLNRPLHIPKAMEEAFYQLCLTRAEGFLEQMKEKDLAWERKFELLSLAEHYFRLILKSFPHLKNVQKKLSSVEATLKNKKAKLSL